MVAWLVSGLVLLYRVVGLFPLVFLSVAFFNLKKISTISFLEFSVPCPSLHFSETCTYRSNHRYIDIDTDINCAKPFTVLSRLN